MMNDISQYREDIYKMRKLRANYGFYYYTIARVIRNELVRNSFEM